MSDFTNGQILVILIWTLVVMYFTKSMVSTYKTGRGGIAKAFKELWIAWWFTTMFVMFFSMSMEHRLADHIYGNSPLMGTGAIPLHLHRPEFEDLKHRFNTYEYIDKNLLRENYLDKVKTM